MAVPSYDRKEVDNKKVFPGFGGSPMVVFDYPCSVKEGVLSTYRREPYWQLSGTAGNLFSPKVNPDNIARGFVFEAATREFTPKDYGGADMFGIEWEYIETVGGSMVRPGKPYIEDANEIKDKIKMPDPTTWDWEGSAKANNGTYLQPGNAYSMWLLNGG